MATDFTINLADLQHILDQIIIAERHAAGENLVDIIGPDAALLPFGLRTVDGSFNNLLPGQSRVGAADEMFPRLLTPEYRNDADGDVMPLGPPGSGAPTITNTNYALPGSVADADPRIISNLISDQTIGNMAALSKALSQNGSTNPFGDAMAIVALRDTAQSAADAAVAAQAAEVAAMAEHAAAVVALATAEAALAAAVQTRDAYIAAAALAETAGSTAETAQDTATVLFGSLTPAGSPINATDLSLLATAVSAANAASIAAQAVVAALGAGPNVTAVDLAAASAVAANALALFNDLTALQTELTTDADGNVDQEDLDAAGEAFILATNNQAAALANATALDGSVTTAGAAVTTAQGNVGLAEDNLAQEVIDLGLATSASDAADLAADNAAFALAQSIETAGLEISSDGSITIPHESPDIGLSPPNSGWMTLFGQFFDHGLDLVTKGGNGTVYIPLQPDDPLYVPGGPNFMAVTRVTPFGADGTDTQNTTTPFVDQNQTYTSVASHQVFLREYVKVDLTNDSIANPTTIATGALLEGANGGIANWAEVKAQALEMLGIKLTDFDVHDVPFLLTDPYGKFIPDPVTGYAQVVTSVDVNGAPLTWVSGTPDNPVDLATVTVVRTGHAFLNDIAHHAAPGTFDHDHNPMTPKIRQTEDTDTDQVTDDHIAGTYDDEMLDAHFITGDGRGNENIGLTTVHFIFHAEHNRIMEANKQTLLDSGDLAVINQWLLVPVTSVPATVDDVIWNGERLFQAARFTTEMQYQHMVFEEFARRIQVNIDPFVFTGSADLDPSILAEFAHVVYRFGHSMLTDTVDRLENDLTTVNGDADQMGLIEAFLNPQAYTASNGGAPGAHTDADAAAAIIRGMSRQVGNEIDEFVVEALRNNLVGLPLDLPAINIARGRETGIPTLNHARAELYEMTGHVDVKPYTSWLDFAQHIKNPISIVNFIAAYGTHDLIEGEATLAGKRAAAMAIVLGVAQDVPANPDMMPPVLAHTVYPPADRLDFLNATGLYAGGDLGGMNLVDMWIGGLAEELNEFGGMLGSTFNFVFEYQLEHLQNGDRFYYLSRTQGMNLLNQLEPNTFADMIMRNTNLGDLHATHLSAEIMEVPDMILELDTLVAQEDYNGAAAGKDPTHADFFQQMIDPKVVRINGTTDVDGNGFMDGNVLKFSGGEHVVLGGTEGNDRLFGDKGIDTLWGDGGNDYLNAGMESDQVFGGEGDDIIEDPFGDDFLRGEAGNDVIVNSAGLDLLFGGSGNDFIMAVTDTTEVFAGEGNDFILGGTAPDILMGNEGDDWIEGGEGFDGLSGENSQLFFNSTIVGHDILNGQGNDTDYDGENGDDIMVQSIGIQRNNGMEGFDWAIHKGDPNGADSDLGIRPFDTRQALILRDRFDSVEGLSGWRNDDILTGAAKLLVGEAFTDQLTQAGVNRIDGLRDVLNIADSGVGTDVVFESDINGGGEIILGGAGSDVIRGNLGNDYLDGDAWLNVRISVMSNKDGTGTELFTVDSLNEIQARLRSGEINPGQLKAVREILNSDGTKVSATGESTNSAVDRDIAVFSDIYANYTIEGANPFADIVGADTNGDGFITITHNAPGGGGGGGAAIDDGIDNIRNFEILQFADQALSLDPTITNNAATGLLAIIDGGAVGVIVGEPLTVALGTVADADGVPPLADFTFLWQFEQTLGAGDWADVTDPLTGDIVTGVSFVPTAAHELDGLRLRVIGSFVGAGNGFPEVVFSAPTDPVAPAAVAAPTAGDDILVGTLGADLINGLAGDDIISSLGGSDVIIGGPGNDILDGGIDTGGLGDIAVFFGPLANFTFILNAEGVLEVVDAAAGEEDAVSNIENILIASVTLTDAQVAAVVAALRGGLPFTDGVPFDIAGITGIAGATAALFNVANILDGTFINDDNNGNALTGTEFGDEIFGNGGDDTIDGLGGDDLLSGGLGDDIIDSGGGNDIISGGGSTAVGNAIRARLGDETFLIGLAETGSDIVRNDGGVETISVGAVLVADVPNQTGSVVVQSGAITTLDAIDDGAGNLALTVNAKSIVITDHFNSLVNAVEFINFNGSTYNSFALGAANYAVSSTTPTAGLPGVNTLLAGTAGNDIIAGDTGNDLLFGSAGTDTLGGGGGNDLLIGGAGADAMTGGLGDDTFEVDNAGDTVIEAAGAGSGTDTVLSSVSFSLAALANVENLTLTGTANINGTGNGAANVITGNSGNNALSGGLGDDTYVIGLGSGTDVITDAGGSDRIVLRTNGAALASLTATDDNLATATGNLVMNVNGEIITVVNHFGPGIAGSVELINFDDATFAGYALGTGDYAISSSDPDGTGTPSARTVTGTAGNDLIAGENGANRIIGGTGNDLLFGAGGNDTLTGGGGDDLIVGGTGTDTAVFSGTVLDYAFSLNASGNLVVTDIRDFSPDGADTLSAVERAQIGGVVYTLKIGTNGNDNLTAGTPPELFLGFDGIDTVTYTAAAAIVASLATGTATNGDRYYGIENLTGGGGADNLTGDANANVLNGGNGNDTLIGGGGDDTLIGGGGTDTAVFGGAFTDYSFALNASGSLVVTDNRVGSPDGVDTLSGVERAQIGGVVLRIGSDGNNTFNAATAPEHFLGFGGIDTVIYGGATAIVASLATGIADNGDSYDSIENLTGGTGGDTLTGDDNANVLNGGGGTAVDILAGGLGNDTFNYTIGGGADTVDGGGGNDTLIISGANNNDQLDVIYNGTLLTTVEGGAVTSVESIVADLGGNADTLSYAGSAAAVTVNLATGAASGFTSIANISNVIGTEQADTLTGGAGGNTLNGGAGADILTGGAGADAINMGVADDNAQDSVRFGAATEFGDTISNFDATGTAGQIDMVHLTSALNTLFDDGTLDDNFTFVSGDGVNAGASGGVTVVDLNGTNEALFLSGANNEGVTSANLNSAAAVATEFNAEFTLTAANGEATLLVINDIDTNDASVWRWIQAGGGEIAAGELTLIGYIDNANATVTTASFDFLV
jgi:Ca2+-binding RTX toxin-like protein